MLKFNLLLFSLLGGEEGGVNLISYCIIRKPESRRKNRISEDI